MYECILRRFFSPWGLKINLFCKADNGKNTKQNILRNPRNIFKTYIYTWERKSAFGKTIFWLKPIHLITKYMNICNLFKIPKRSRNFFVMQGIDEVITAVYECIFFALKKANLHNIHSRI